MSTKEIEQKAAAYDKAIKKIKYVMDRGVEPILNKADLQSIFPELKESEDERIRKELIKKVRFYIDGDIPCGYDAKKALAWLEKQGEQSLANSAKTCKAEPKFKNAEWSNEDEEKLIMCCKFLHDASVCIDYDVSHKEEIAKCIQWLKSLRPQNHWKPSDEQLNALYDVLNPADEVDKNQLESLYNDLKKLKE